jgi:hypothetical protein
VRGAKDGNDFALIAAIDAEIGFVGGKDCVARIEFAHADKAEIGQVWLPIGIANCEILKLREVARAIKRHAQGLTLKHP